ncbi:MAG: hypothetical protein Q3976_03815 [Corynebacterium sp.]|nr:hypothetical protein [Corynebacterium sp.]
MLVGIPFENNLALLLHSLSIMIAMSAGSAKEEIAARRWLVPTVIVGTIVASIGINMTDGMPRLILTLTAIVLIILAVTALRNRRLSN